MGALDRLARLIDGAVFAVCAVLTVAMVALVVVAVAMRYWVGSPLIYSYDLSTLLFAWVVFLGLYLAERDRAHLAVDLLDGALPAQGARWVRIARQLAVAGLSLFVAAIGWKLFQRAGQTIPSMRISIGWLYASLPLGFLLLAVAQLLRLSHEVAPSRRASG